MVAHEPLELADDFGVAAAIEIRVDAFLEADRKQLLESSDLTLHRTLVREVRKRRSAPE
jgi:hypothetical protein